MDSYRLQVVRLKLDAVFSLLKFPLVLLFLCVFGDGRGLFRKGDWNFILMQIGLGL